MRKFVLLTLLFLLNVTISFADSYTDANGVTWNYTVNNNTVYIDWASGFGETVVVPSTIDGKTVTAIGKLFSGSTTIKHATIPTTVTSANSTFANCTNLIDVEGLSYCVEIWANTFLSCENLTTVDLARCTSIGANAFYGCKNLTSVGNLSNCQTIGNCAFEYCSSLTTVDLSGCTSIGLFAFANCTQLTSVGTTAKCVTIGGNAFESCGNLTSIDLQSCTTIEACAFYHCSQLSSVGNTANLESVGNTAFAGCENLKTINLEKCTTIGKTAFSGCTSFSDVNIKSNVLKMIDQYAFYDAKNIEIDALILDSIGDKAFNSALKFSINTPTPPRINAAFNSNTVIYVPAALVNTYKAADGWKQYASQIKAINPAYNLTFKSNNNNTIEAGKATLKIGDTQFVPINNKVDNIEGSTHVTITTAQGYKFKSISVSIPTAPTNFASLNDDKTEASFDMPNGGTYINYTIVRDMLIDVNGPYVFIDGQPATSVLIAKDVDGHYQLQGNWQFTAIDNLTPAYPDTLTNGQLVYTLKKKVDESNYEAVNFDTDLAPGTWRLEAEGNTYTEEGIAYGYEGNINGADITLYANASVTDISLNLTSTTRVIGHKFSLTPTITPNDATDTTVKWSVTQTDEFVKLYSDDNYTIPLSTDAIEAGIIYVKAMAEGSATIKVESNADATKYAECTITVRDPYSNGELVSGVIDLATVTKNITVANGSTLKGKLGIDVKISIADGATVTLKDASINADGAWKYVYDIFAGITCLGDATIILEGDNSVKGFDEHYPGIYVPENKMLTIKGSGSLTAGSNGTGAGIGAGSKGINCGNILISGGKITASGKDWSPGIGGSYGSSCGTITITDEVISVTAMKGYDAPCSIGKGYNGTCGTVTIGGVVYPDGIAESPYTYIPNKDEFITVYTPTTPIPYSADLEAINYDKIVYQRSFDAERVGKFQAWFVPFDYTITAGDTEKFDFFKINFIANAGEEGINPESDKVYVFLNPVAAGKTLQGNMPYVYRPKEAVQNYQFVADGVGTKLLPQNTSVVMETSTTTTTYQFYGTYSNMTATTANPFYYISINGAICYGTDVSVGPFRWLMKATNKSGNPAYYSRSITFVESGTTGIEDISDKRCNETGDFYDLQGRKVAQPSKGLYIVNGRKVVIK